MKRYHISPHAQRQIDEIADYTLANWGYAKSASYVFDLYDRFQWLADNPMLGRERSELKPGLRSFRQGSHIVFYFLEDEEIQIVAVPHGAMDAGAAFE